MNLWHDVPLGEKAPKEFNCIIEIPKGSYNKYEIDKDTGLIALDRVNYTAAPYPCDYGFAPKTLWEDGDALDVLVLTEYPLPTGILVAVRPIGVFDMVDSGESDAKILAVPASDRRYEHVHDIADVSPHFIKQIKHFFETYKGLKSDTKTYEVTIPTIRGAADAETIVMKSQELYNEKFGA